MVDIGWKEWSDGWIKEGYFISYLKDGVHYFEYVLMRDFGHYEWEWGYPPEAAPQTILAGQESGPYVPDYLELTKAYDEKTKLNQIWQVIWGMKGQVLLYVELPTDTHRHGIPKVPKPRTNLRRVSHFEEWMSPFDEPCFITEHFMMRPDLDRINFSAYNPNAQDEPDLVLNFFLNKMVTERIGTVTNGVQEPTSDKWSETLDKLYRRLIPVRPISLYPVMAPAEAHR